ncbi:MAG: DUF4838 domain-containing protein [Clostridia bacterium]|nr:DUF4838 domain-containing protein [Clostridia bacterium]
MKKFLNLVAAALALTVAVSCGSTGAGDTSETGGNDQPPKTNKTMFDSAWKPASLTDNGEDVNQYHIVISSSAGAATKNAASELSKYIGLATGEALEVITDDIEESDLEIVIGKTTREISDGVDTEKLGEEGYEVKNIGKKLLIAASDSRGALYGVYSYLEALGYRYYSSEVEKIPEASQVFVAEDVDISRQPVFEYRDALYYALWGDDNKKLDLNVKWGVNSSYVRADLANKAKYGGARGYIGGNKYLVHTIKHLLPFSTYGNEHRDWYCDRSLNNDFPKNNDYVQLCYTNYDSRETLYRQAVALIKAYPNSNILSISQNDAQYYCQCENCLKSYEEYGYSGTMLLYLNDIAERIKKDYPYVIIDTLSYGFTEDLPKKGVVPADNICIRLCTSMCPFHTDDEGCEKLKLQEKRIEDWSEICDNLYIWCYPIAWSDQYAAWPNYDALFYDNRFYADHNVKGVYTEGFPNDDPEFGNMKAYLMAKILKDPYMSIDEYHYHMNDFLEGYYGEGYEYIKKYIALIYDKVMERIEKWGDLNTKPTPATNLIFEYDEQKKEFVHDWVDKCNEYWDMAEDLADGDQIDRVKKSRLHWTYIELYNTFDTLYENAAAVRDLDTMNELEARNEKLHGEILKYNCIKMYPENSISRNVTWEESPTRWWH